MLPLVRLLDGQGTVVIRSGEATDGVGQDARDLTGKNTDVAGTSRTRHLRHRDEWRPVTTFPAAPHTSWVPVAARRQRHLGAVSQPCALLAQLLHPAGLRPGGGARPRGRDVRRSLRG